ncbi:LptA/OstA family protein [Pseudahrensia aquimaris]|uniref:LptA/OstA family protein n=2 Tax=Pseudahrensia aquimaris TaxID=744461 RepID=A0ABW3FH21_9HYPH
MIATVALATLVVNVPADTAFAQASGKAFSGFSGSSKDPIQIGADELEIVDSENRATYSGRVQVTQGCSTLKADKLTAFYARNSSGGDGNSQGNIEKLAFSGNVFVSSGENTATAKSGSFNTVTEDVVLEGDVIVSQGRNAAKGCKLTANLKTNVAKLHSCGKRVVTMINPNAVRQAAKPCN